MCGAQFKDDDAFPPPPQTPHSCFINTSLFIFVLPEGATDTGPATSSPGSCGESANAAVRSPDACPGAGRLHRLQLLGCWNSFHEVDGVKGTSAAGRSQGRLIWQIRQVLQAFGAKGHQQPI